MSDEEITVPAEQAEPEYVNPFAEEDVKNPETAPQAADAVKVPGDAQPNPDALTDETDPEAEGRL